MYYAEQDKNGEFGRAGYWLTFEPDGTWICSVPNEYQAEALLLQLNKGR